MRVAKPEGSKRWVVEWYDDNDRRHRWAAYTDKGESERLGRILDQVVYWKCRGGQAPNIAGVSDRMLRELGRLGLVNYVDVQLSMDGFLDGYRKHLQTKEAGERHIRCALSHLRRAIADIGAAEPAELTIGTVSEHLKRYRDAGAAMRTSNDRLAHVKAFCSWLVRERKLSENPVRYLDKLNDTGDRRGDHEPLEPDQVVALLAGVQASHETKNGCTSRERYWIYRIAVETGLRAGELRSLRIRDCDLMIDEPTITVRAAYSRKRKKTSVVPIKRQTAEQMAGFLEQRSLSKRWWNVADWAACETPLFPDFPKNAADMLRKDLEAVGIPYKVDDGRYRTFHGLRHTFITNASYTAQSFADLQALARHSTPAQTARYTHARMVNMRKAVEGLPDSTGRSEPKVPENRT